MNIAWIKYVRFFKKYILISRNTDMIKHKKRIIEVAILLTLPVSLFSQKITKVNPGAEQKTAGGKERSPIEYSVIFKAAGGGLFNYMEYKVDSPFADATLIASLDLSLTKNILLTMAYKVDGQKSFTPVNGTKYSLDQLYQQGQIKLEMEIGKVKLETGMMYSWMLRPSWPDLYQPNPLLFGAKANPEFGSYLPTDRNSYHKLYPEITAGYNGIANLNLELDVHYIRNLEYIDPNYVFFLPTHLTPSTYSGLSGEIKGTYKLSKTLHIKLKNENQYRSYDYELARDAITGKTNFVSTPNPLYREFNNITTLGVDIILTGIKMKIKPFASLDISTDLYQGYYTYTGIEPGIEIEHKIEKFSYSIKFSEEMRFFSPNGFNPTLTTDKKSLYKYYTKGEINLKYRFNKHIESFINAEMLIKQTNYPAYTPGIYPASKNYNIDFNFQNYGIWAGASYTL